MVVAQHQQEIVGSVSKEEITISIVLIYNVLLPSICAFATLPARDRAALVDLLGSRQ
jgi:hypothetical protein